MLQKCPEKSIELFYISVCMETSMYFRFCSLRHECVCGEKVNQPSDWFRFLSSRREEWISAYGSIIWNHMGSTSTRRWRCRIVGERWALYFFRHFLFFWIQELVTVAKSDLEADNEVIKGSRPVMRRPDKNRMDWRRHLLPKRLFVNFDSGESRHIDFLGRSRVKDRYTRFSLWPGCCCRRLKTDSKGMRLCWFSARSKFRFQRKVFHPFKIIAE